jgi:hypothetical protein
MPPHNPFGARLRQLGQELVARGEDSTLPSRLRAAAEEDSDGDGMPNELEIVAGHAPGDPADAPAAAELAAARAKVLELRRRQPAYAWRPFQPVARPPVPQVPHPAAPALVDPRGPIDAFIEDALLARGLEPRPEAPKEVLLRRVSLDLTGLSPSPRELEDFAADTSPDAYEKVVDRLLASPSYGERWGRHWMDVWRYSDWAGWGEQVRDSQPHIWRWRDWIVESMNEDKPYDRMVVEMLAGDELAPLDPSTLRATGYLARSFKLLSREAWMQEAVDHCAQAFLGLTAGCARCHDHMYDPISQKEYYQLRAFFEPYNVRLDRVPWEADTKRDGVARVFDAAPDVKTYLFIRGDDRRPDKEHPLLPGFPAALGAAACDPQAVSLPLAAYAPEKQESARAEALRAADVAVTAAREAFRAALTAPAKADEGRDRARQAELDAGVAAARRDALAAVLDVERLEDSGGQGTDAWKGAALKTVHAQRWLRLLEAQKESVAAQSAVADAQRAQKASSAPAAAGNAGQAAPAADAASGRSSRESRRARGESGESAFRSRKSVRGAGHDGIHEARDRDLPGRQHGTPDGARALDRPPRESARGPRRRQPHLAAALRAGARPKRQRSGPERASSDPSGPPRLARCRADGARDGGTERRLVHEGHPPRHRDLIRVPPRLDVGTRAAWLQTPTIRLTGAWLRVASRPKRCATMSFSSRGSSIGLSAGRSSTTRRFSRRVGAASTTGTLRRNRPSS